MCWVLGNLFNQQMIEGGFAHEYTYSTPYRYQGQFREAERSLSMLALACGHFHLR